MYIYISLTELAVSISPSSISRQSSVSHQYPILTGASKALDGYSSSRNLVDGHCSATNLITNGQVNDQWWAVDLAKILRPVYVKLTNALGLLTCFIEIDSKSLQIYMKKEIYVVINNI